MCADRTRRSSAAPTGERIRTTGGPKMAEAYADILYEKTGQVARITINRP